jgi:hypothetical protein
MSLREEELPTTSLREVELSTTSRATCRGTRTCGGCEVVDDEPSRHGVVNDKPRDNPRDKPRDVPRHPDARRR